MRIARRRGPTRQQTRLNTREERKSARLNLLLASSRGLVDRGALGISSLRVGVGRIPPHLALGLGGKIPIKREGSRIQDSLTINL
jgi:hypothetical protein